jgi:acetone carboxylase gamma subunit
MNLKQFIAELKNANKHWHVSKVKSILRDDDNFSCPITSLQGADCQQFDEVGISVGLPNVLITAIVHAADNMVLECHHTSNMFELRKLLLDACGVNENA